MLSTAHEKVHHSSPVRGRTAPTPACPPVVWNSGWPAHSSIDPRRERQLHFVSCPTARLAAVGRSATVADGLVLARDQGWPPGFLMN